MQYQIISQNREQKITPIVETFYRLRQQLHKCRGDIAALEAFDPAQLSDEQCDELEAKIDQEIKCNEQLHAVMEEMRAVNMCSPKELSRSLANIDWSRVSKNVVGKSEWDVKIQWINGDHPDINKAAWTKEEQGRLAALVEQHGTVDWTRIASELQTNRTPYDVFCKYQRTNKALLKSRWTKEEDAALRQAVYRYGLNNWTAGMTCSFHFVVKMTNFMQWRAVWNGGYPNSACIATKSRWMTMLSGALGPRQKMNFYGRLWSKRAQSGTGTSFSNLCQGEPTCNAASAGVMSWTPLSISRNSPRRRTRS